MSKPKARNKLLRPASSQTLKTLLQGVPEFKGGVLETYVADIVSALDVAAADQAKLGRDALIAANVKRYRLGQAWLQNLPEKRSEREKWMREQGRPHDIRLTRVKQIIRAARALGPTKSAVRLPIAVFDRRLEEIPVAVKNALAGKPLDSPVVKTKPAPMTPGQRQSRFLLRVSSAAKTIFEGHDDEIPVAIEALVETWAPVPQWPAVVRQEAANTNPARRPPIGARPPSVLKNFTGPINYPGGKSNYLPRIVPHLPEGTRLLDPFVGAGSVPLAAAKMGLVRHLWLVDKEPSVCALWMQLVSEKGSADLIRRVAAYTPDDDSVRALRGVCLGATAPQDELAFATYVAFSTAYGGLGPSASDSIDLRRWARGRKVERLTEIAAILASCSVRVTQGSALDVLRDRDSARFCIYADPPYPDVGDALYNSVMTEAQHRELAQVLLDRKDWVLSYGKHELIGSLYSECDCRVISKQTPERGTGQTSELLIGPRGFGVQSTEIELAEPDLLSLLGRPESTKLSS